MAYFNIGTDIRVLNILLDAHMRNECMEDTDLSSVWDGRAV